MDSKAIEKLAKDASAKVLLDISRRGVLHPKTIIIVVESAIRQALALNKQGEHDQTPDDLYTTCAVRDAIAKATGEA